MPTNNLFNNVQTAAKWVCMEGLDMLLNRMVAGRFYSNEYSKDFAQKFAIGNVAAIPLTQRWRPQRNDMTYNPGPMDRPVTTLSVDQTSTQSLEWESIEQALQMERGQETVRKNYLNTAINYIRQDIETDLCKFAAQNISMVTGALGTDPTTYDATSATALQRMTQMGCPEDQDNLGLLVPPSVRRSVKTAAIGYFNPTVDLSKQFRTGRIGQTDSFDWYSSNSLYRHTAGTWAGAVTINAGGQSGTSFTVACTTGDTVKQGDKFSVANMNEVNLMTRQPTSTSTAGTKTLTATADATGVGSVMTISFLPPIYGPGSNYQNVDALPANGAALTLWPGTVSPNGKIGTLALGMYPGVCLLAGCKLEQPKGSVEFCEQEVDPDTGIAIRVIRQWDNIQSRMTTRMDALWGRGVGLNDQLGIVIACA